MEEATQSWSLKMTAPLEPGIVCNDIERMLEFYVGILGLELVADADTARDEQTPGRYAPRISNRPPANALR